MNGLTDLVSNLYNTFEPDLRITTTKGKYFNATDSLLAEIKKVDGVVLISKTITDKALIKNINQQVLVAVKGVDADFEKVTNIQSSVTEGIYALDDTTGNRILIGKGIANQIQLNMSSFVNEISLLSPTKGKITSINPQEQLNQIYCNPSGVFSLNDEFDYQYVFVNIKTANQLFEANQRVTALEISIQEDMAKEVQLNLEQKLGKAFTIKNRYQANDVLFKSLETEKVATFFILAFILIIATFNMIGALTMLIIEKKKDIKTLYNMGASMQTIRNIFMREGFLITGIGAIGGLLIGLLVCLLQMKFHLVKFGNDFIVPYYPIQLMLQDFVWILSAIMVIGFFAALYPVRVFTKTDLVH
jgi:lipoprotein-releasing system permease protein